MGLPGLPALGMTGLGALGLPSLQMPGMMPFPQLAYPFGPQGYQEGEGGVLRGGGKRGRDGEAATTFKRHQADQPPFVVNPSYFQQTAGGQMHPCVRIYGSCRDGAWCKYALMPIGACLQYLKGNCKFGDACHEPHVQLAGQEHRNKGPGSKHPCERIYGFCQDGERCRFADFPAESCLMYLKGRCKFGDSCRELHTRGAVEPDYAAEPAPENQ